MYFHNDPLSMNGSKTINQRLNIISKVEKIIFVSEYLKKRFFNNLNTSHKNNVEVIGNAIDKLKNFPKKEKLIIFSGKLNIFL